MEDKSVTTAVTLYGQTEIVAVVKSVIDDEPRAVLQTPQGDTLSCQTTAEIAAQLGERLGRQVKVRGAAQWDFETLAITGFEIAAVLPYERTPPTEAFAALRERFGAAFDQTDDD